MGWGRDSKCNRKPVEGPRKKWAFIFVKTLHLGSYVKGRDSRARVSGGEQLPGERGGHERH